MSSDSESKKGNYLVWTDINDSGITEHDLKYFTSYDDASELYNRITRRVPIFTHSNSYFTVRVILYQINDKTSMEEMRRFYRMNTGEGIETVTKKKEI